MKITKLLLFFILLSVFSCENDSDVVTPTTVSMEPNLTIFFVNDNHGQINNFSKVKAIVDEAKANGNALLVSAGDIFAGNPIVDQFE